MRNTVFLSHVAEDGDLAVQLARGLEEAGYSTWYYERDSMPGPSYLGQIVQALSHAGAMVVLISRAALASWQVDKEVVQAHERGLPFLPLLHGVTYEQVRAQRPEWTMAFGAAVALPLPSADVMPLLPRITAGLRWLVPEGAPVPEGVPSENPSPVDSGYPAVPAADQPAAAPARQSIDLPAPLTPLLGREREVADVTALLRQEPVRLVTLTGPGGVGKTRLGLEVATALRDAFDTVAFVALAHLTEAAQVPAAIAQTLGLAEEGARPMLALLREALYGRAVLLVLDNLEQVLEAAPIVAELLAACPQLKILATSRVPLRVRGEHNTAVAPLAVPDPADLPDLQTLTEYGAVALFIARAQEVKASFAVTPATAPAIAEICARLDGLPLAIELAAARTRLLAPQALLARLERRLPLLTGGARDLPARQQTLRQAIAWSYDLLTPAEQTLFRRLAVFVGGCTLEAVDGVCIMDENPEIDVLDGLATLVDSSLVQQSDGDDPDAAGDDGEPRFTMLATIREFAWDELTAHGDVETMQRRHSTYLLALAEAAEPEVRATGHGQWMKRLEAEHDNLRAALAWARQHRDAETGLRLSGALWWFWHLHGHIGEGRRWLEEFLAMAGPAGVPAGSPAARAKALTGLGALAWSQGDHAEAATLAADSLAIAQSLGDKAGTAMALMILGNALNAQGDFAGATARYEESLSLFREVGDHDGVALALTTLGIVAGNEGDLERASVLYEEALALSRARGATWNIANLLNNLGTIAYAQGDLERAAARFHESLAMRRDIHDRLGMALALTNLGGIAAIQGQSGDALAAYHEALPLLRELGHKEGLVECLAGIAHIAVEQGQPELGVQLCAAVSALRDATGISQEPSTAESCGRAMDAARARLGESVWAAEWATGLALPLSQAIAQALAMNP